jgi:hypothetical protein
MMISGADASLDGTTLSSRDANSCHAHCNFYGSWKKPDKWTSVPEGEAFPPPPPFQRITYIEEAIKAHGAAVIASAASPRAAKDEGFHKIADLAHGTIWR